MKPLVAIDYDGTLVESVWPRNDGMWLPGATDALRSLDEHVKLVIHTSRIAPVHPSGALRSAAEVQEEINEIYRRLREIGLKHVPIWTEPYKPAATVFVDDRAVNYPGRRKSWANLTPKILLKAGINPEDINV